MRIVPEEPIRFGAPKPRLPDPDVTDWPRSVDHGRTLFLPPMGEMLSEIRPRVVAVRDWLLCLNLVASLVLMVALVVGLWRGR